MSADDYAMIAAADRAERILRAQQARAAFRARYMPQRRFLPPPRPIAPRRIIAGPRFQRAFSRNIQGNTGPEIKAFDISVIPDAVNLTPNTYSVPYLTGVAGIGGTNAFTGGLSCINCVQQGANFYQRIGSKITVKSIDMRGTIQNQAGSGTNQIVIRAILFYDKQPNGAFPTYADLLANNDAAPTFDSSVALINRSRFVIIRDQYITIDPGLQTTVPFKCFAKGAWESEYGSNTGLIGDLRTGAIHFMAFGNITFLGGSGSTGPSWTNLHCRIRYSDN